MGGCFPDVKGGQQAIGGGQPRPMAVEATSTDAVDHFYRGRGQFPLFTQLELSLSATKLRDLDILSKSDPMTAVYLRKSDGVLEELGCTEVVLNSLNPAWIIKVPVTYHFEMVQHLVFHVYDVDTKYHNIPAKALKLKDQEFLG